MRAVSSPVMAALMLVALFWGNCYTCPQMMVGHQAAHSCCHRHGKAPASECHSQGLRHFQAPSGADAAPAVALVGMAQGWAGAAVMQRAAVFAVLPEHDPPDLVTLNSSLRI
jgi:hypothetical protein